MENSWCFPCVTTGARYHKEGAKVLSTKVRAGQWQEVQGRIYLRQCNLYQRSRRIPSRAILFDCMERLPRRKEYLGTFLGCHVPLDNGQYLSQGPSEEANSNISTPGLRSAHGQVNDPAPCKAKAKTTIKTHQEARQVRWQRRGDKEEAIRKRRQKRIQVSAVLKPEAGRKPKICFPSVGSVKEPVVAVWPLVVWFLKNYITFYSDQVPYYPSPLSSKSLIIQVLHRPNHVSPLSINFGFPFPVLSPDWKVFSSTIFMIFRFFSSSPSLVGRFFINWSLVRFSSSVSYWVRRFFTNDMTFWDSSASLRG